MADISVYRSHDLSLAEAQGKVDEIISDIQDDFGNLVSKIKWNSDKTVADVSGKGFTGKFTVNAEQVGIEISLKLFAKPLKGKVQGKVEERIVKYFG